jgi:hypothetical protein
MARAAPPGLVPPSGIADNDATMATGDRDDALERADLVQVAVWMSHVTLRLAGDADRPALDALAAAAHVPAPRSPVLVVEQDGVLRAAHSLRDAITISDPLAGSIHLERLLAAHAAPRARGARALGRLRRSLRRWAALWERHASADHLGVSGQDAVRAMREARRGA